MPTTSSDPAATEARWRRPVPLIGDSTSAAQRAAEPNAWAFPPSARDVVYSLISARRDVRRYRPDDVPDDLLRSVLGAGHAAPSVGHSQPWRFVVMRDPVTRERAALLADAERLRQAALLDPDSGRRLLDLQLEGIREAPVGIVVCCDRRTPAAGVLGRATFADADLWSCACAIENMWLAARAEGLGLGWVTLFRPEDLAELLHLPDGVVTLGWLCVGWPDERPPEPGLERAGWSQRLTLDEVVLQERWPDSPTAAPAQPRSRLRAPDRHAVVGARDDADRLLTSPGSLGVLDRALDRVVALGRRDANDGVLVLAGADHPVTAHRISAYPAHTTRDVLEAAVAGEALGVSAASSAGLGSVIVDAGVNGGPVIGAMDLRPVGGRGDLVTQDALDRADTDRLFTRGRALGREIGGQTGLVALGEVGIGNTTIAAALACLLLDLTPHDAVGLGAGADTAMVDRKIQVVTAAVSRARQLHGDALEDPLVALGAVGGPELAVLAGVVLGAAEHHAVVVLDGLVTSLAALVASLLEPGSTSCFVAGQRSREQAHQQVLQRLGLEPLLDLRMRAGEGAGACFAAGLVLAGLATRRQTGLVRPV